MLLILGAKDINGNMQVHWEKNKLFPDFGFKGEFIMCDLRDKRHFIGVQCLPRRNRDSQLVAK